MCYTLLLCPQCDVVYACESPTGAEIGNAYHQAAYDSRAEALDAARSYERALLPHLASMEDRRGVLEVGTGTGVFLQRMRAQGFSGIAGVEPSRAAIEAADPGMKPYIREGVFEAADFQESSFSLIACFMTLEHVTDPALLVRDCYRLLRPGGLMACVVHNWRAWNNRVLGRRAPIIDIEHLQLFSRDSISQLFRRSKFVDIECRSFWNNYRIVYWNRLLPTPAFLKRGMDVVLHHTGIGQLRLPMNVGNLMVVARKEKR